MNVKDDKHRNTGNRAPRRALLAYLRHLSEENWAAGWLTDLEHTLWDWVLRYRNRSEPTSDFERANLEDIEVLSWLAEQAGGWWRWDDASNEPIFIAHKEWSELHQNKATPDATEHATTKRTKYLYGGQPAEVKPANGAKGVLIRADHGKSYAFRVYHGNDDFTDYAIRHDDLGVTIDSDALAAFYRVGDNNILDHSPEVLGLKITED